MTSNKVDTKIRKYGKLPICIVEDHCEVLPIIQRAIGSKHLPFSGVTIVHFDAHPDLLLPDDLTAADVFDKEKLMDKVNIESWILPLCFAGHLSEVLWVKPSWSNQLPDGVQSIAIGECKHTGRIRVDCAQAYLLSDCLWAPENHMLDGAARFILNVQTLGIEPNAPMQQGDSDIVNVPFILDIDLDFFSTADPFLETLGQTSYNFLRQLYSFQTPSDKSQNALVNCIENRRCQLAENRRLLETIWQNPELTWDGSLCPDKMKFELCVDLIQSVQNSKGSGESPDAAGKVSSSDTIATSDISTGPDKTGEEPITVELLHSAGCTMDSTGLPHHISTEREIEAALSSFAAFITRLPRPTLVTVARSTVDGYCPKEQVERIQTAVLDLLKDIYCSDDVEISFLYET